MTLDESVINENGEIWAGDPRDLAKKLDRYYGVEGLRLMPDFYHQERDEYLYDVLAYRADDECQFIAVDLDQFGHGPSGAAGVDPESLPDADRVTAVVEGGESA